MICQSWTLGNHLLSNDSKKMIPWNVTTENTMERLLKLNPLWPTCIWHLAFAHKGFIFDSFSIVFSVMTFQGIVFLAFFLFVLVLLFDLRCQKRGFLCSKWHFKCQQNANTHASLGIWQTEQEAVSAWRPSWLSNN